MQTNIAKEYVILKHKHHIQNCIYTVLYIDNFAKVKDYASTKRSLNSSPCLRFDNFVDVKVY
jgi:hypothetical protein